MNEQWFYGQNGVQKGPASVEVMRQLVAGGQIKRDDLVWKEGMADWAPAGSVADLFAQSQAVPPVTPQPVSVSPVPPVSGAPIGPTQTYNPQEAALASKATTALVLGICSIVLGACICSPIGLGLGIAAVVMGKNAELAPNAGNAKGGFVCGIIGIALSLAGCLPQMHYIMR